jgi:[ribosomal protein S18]-alanine N-acetyltransferase
LAHLLAMPGGFGLIARLYEGGLARIDAMRGVGFSLCRVVRDESELLSIGVAAGYRRRGVAGYLLRASMERARAIGARQMFLEVAVDNGAAQQLYLVHGFERVGTRPEYYQRQNGERTAAHTMRCSLDAYGSWPANPA